jgi:hypothetical protein
MNLRKHLEEAVSEPELVSKRKLVLGMPDDLPVVVHHEQVTLIHRIKVLQIVIRHLK